MLDNPPTPAQVKVFAQKLVISLTVFLAIFAIVQWGNYSAGTDLKKSIQSCQTVTDNKADFNSCLKFPIQKHEAIKSSALLLTDSAIFLPVLFFGSIYLYKFFFQRKKEA
ncbi:hypothetical protein HY025_00525 [Candidatus Daviesbacteria bacterium]|nr:hypothetical protein [Candidatus Daviesbacteria bacterium]